MSQDPPQGIASPESAREPLLARLGLLRDPDQAREAVCLLYAAVGLSLVFFHGRPRNMDADWGLFVWFGVNFLVLFCVPALIIRLGWKHPLARYGLQWGDFRIWGRYFAVFFAGMVPLIILISRDPGFAMYYPRFSLARIHAGYLLLSAGGWLVYFFAWEWFFRGFMLFALAPRLGAGTAILVQTIPFVMMHYPKIEAEAWSSIICGIALGLMAYRGRSFVGTWLLHWLVATSMDVLVVLWPLR
ncbi:MAG: CPBP family intramembrane metalloprotease [Armatimonadetes bacterium]|nr:CPBP family intramembrane metalloprotease [Armatimonadota bacterium]MDI9586796.1 CPBP family intramembrane metalloprotease [Acidobacteriota bacterium]